MDFSKFRNLTIFGSGAGPNADRLNWCSDRECNRCTLAVGLGSGSASRALRTTPQSLPLCPPYSISPKDGLAHPHHCLPRQCDPQQSRRQLGVDLHERAHLQHEMKWSVTPSQKEQVAGSNASSMRSASPSHAIFEIRTQLSIRPGRPRQDAPVVPHQNARDKGDVVHRSLRSPSSTAPPHLAGIVHFVYHVPPLPDAEGAAIEHGRSWALEGPWR